MEIANFGKYADNIRNIISRLTKSVFKHGYKQGFKDCEDGLSMDLDDKIINLKIKEKAGLGKLIKDDDAPEIEFPSFIDEFNESHTFNAWHHLLAHSTFEQEDGNTYIIDPSGHKTAVIKFFEKK